MDTKLIKTAFFTPGPGGRWGLPMILIGDPGSAKTSSAEAVAADTGLFMETIISSLREPSDFLGLPIPIKAKDGSTRVQYAPPEWAVNLAEKKHGVAFFDEINTSPPAVQAALLRVALDGVVGEFALPKTIRFIAAMNSTEDAAGGWDLAAPLANRFGHLVWDAPSAEDWGDWLLAPEADDANLKKAKTEKARVDRVLAEEARVMSLWDEPFAVARGLVAGFIRKRPELLMQKPAAGDPKAGKAWPSPRSWELATRALAGATVHDLSEAEREIFLASFVGNGPVAELAVWLAEADLPDPKDVLDGKVKFRHDASRLDRTAAVLQACAAYVSPERCANRKERAGRLWEILGDVDDALDVVVPAARVLVRAKLAGLDEARPVLMVLQPVLAAAGVKPR